LSQNAANAQNVLRQAIKTLPSERRCRCGAALAHALITDPKVIPAATKKKLAVITGKYLS
jgi:5'-methylthioadenosine phosphorylase